MHRATSVFAGVIVPIGLAETDMVERAARRWLAMERSIASDAVSV
jgi:hypothetical protein